MGQSLSPADWQKRFQNWISLGTGLAPMVQHRAEDLVEFIDANNRKTCELIKNAVQASATFAFADNQAKWTDFHLASLAAMRSSLETLNLVHARAISAWISFLRNQAETAKA
jgi:hypothetical protein